MATKISQAADQVDLEWTRNDPVSLAFTVEGVDWSGSYGAEVRALQSPTAPLLASFTVVATKVGADTAFTLTLTDSTPVVGPVAYWDLHQVAGLTRLTGRVLVKPDVTA